MTMKLCLPHPLTKRRPIVFGSIVVLGSVVFVVAACIVVVIVFCVIPCEHDNFCDVSNFIFKLEPCIDHIKVSDEFKNWWP